MELNDKLKENRKKIKTQNNKKIDKKSEKKALNHLINPKPDERGAEIPLRPVSKFTKSKNESDIQFLNRIDKVNRI